VSPEGPETPSQPTATQQLDQLRRSGHGQLCRRRGTITETDAQTVLDFINELRQRLRQRQVPTDGAS
jgi:hypothetical protein